MREEKMRMDGALAQAITHLLICSTVSFTSTVLYILFTV
jgi:hypothetical protein